MFLNQLLPARITFERQQGKVSMKGLLKWILTTGLMYLSSAHTLQGQMAITDLKFGMNLFLPDISGYRGSQDFTHNFFLGINHRRPLNEKWYVHAGFFTNGLLYRYESTDSPKVKVVTMNNLSVPLQLEWRTKDQKLGFLFGMEPKRRITGHVYSAFPRDTVVLGSDNESNIYRRWNLGLRAGISFMSGPRQFFFQLSRDISPYYVYNAVKLYDFRLMFGISTLILMKSRVSKE